MKRNGGMVIRVLSWLIRAGGGALLGCSGAGLQADPQGSDRISVDSVEQMPDHADHASADRDTATTRAASASASSSSEAKRMDAAKVAPDMPQASDTAAAPPPASEPHQPGASAASTGEQAPGASAAELLEECGIAPPGLQPHFVSIESSASAGVLLSMAIQGDAKLPPLVLVHGFPDFWCGWARVMPELATHYFVVAADMRGYNRSSKPGNPDAPQDLDAYRLPVLAQDLADIVHYAAMQTGQKVGVVAHDWGAIVAWRYAPRFPSDLARLMAIAVPHPEAMAQFSSSTDPALRDAQLAQSQALTYVSELVMADSPRYYSDNAYQRLFASLDQKHLQDPGKFPEVERAAYRRMWDADNQASFKSQIKYYRANFGPTAQGQPGDLTTPVPTTFIAPIHDGAVLYPHSMDYLREHVAQSQPLVLRPIDTGHFPQREEPELLTRMIVQFMTADW